MKFYYTLAMIAVFSLVFWLSPFEKPQELKFQFASQPEEYMSQVMVWSFTDIGNLKHHLSTRYWAYRPEKASSTLTMPHLTIYKPDQTRWHIDAEHGRVTQRNIGHIEQVELLDHVILERPATKTDMQIKIETEVMRYQPKKQYAETDKQITLTKPDLKITGKGMRAFLETGFVELLHNVNTSYAPNP